MTSKPSRSLERSTDPSRVARRVAAEVVGTFALTFASLGASVLARSGLLPEAAAFSIVPALTVLAVIYALSDVSGAHINPAVTLAFAARGSFPWRRVPMYWAAQLLGAALAAGVVQAVAFLPRGHERVPWAGAFGLDVACTAFLVLVVLATAKRKATVGPETGLVVGAVVALNHFTTNAVSEVTMNPARIVGPALLEARLGEAAPHVLGAFVGALLGVALTWTLRGPRNDDEEKAARGDAEGV
ncbi:MIP/aquaporin family protein [Deinococcus yavapaiensis]|uniref:Glycerol uptake facilitator-like aquaporin n=1 Tax=Deinococcus yavapaiensis KR-236 TaxID=694435 RepID=A0A318SFM6_9DEIO|nr:aquaporin [Deinococcus yavapaiensis]PYE55666.1 glycerol uptake facilitator-like aquaporin [Deinococcus yavapaiensis KR-236]